AGGYLDDIHAAAVRGANLFVPWAGAISLSPATCDTVTRPRLYTTSLGRDEALEATPNKR
ncbi:hypothetical protein H0A36_29620, partial [Endozoicomonas sp. SM1973]